MSADEIVIGEGVTLEVRSAAPPMRALAWIIDAAVQLAGGMALLWLMATVASDFVDSSSASAMLIALLATVTVVAPATVEALTRGRSLGKLALGLRVVREDGGPIRFRHAFVRALAGVFELWLSMGFVALIVSLFNDRGRRVGDFLAGTYVARVRGGERALPAVYAPPHLIAWARTADIRRLPDGVALAARQYLGRAAGLNPASRSELGTSLAQRIEGYVTPPPPAGTTIDDYLAAVLAERRDREYAIGLGRQRHATELARRLTTLPYQVPDA